MRLPVEESEFIPCDLLDIVRHLRRRNPSAAIRFVESLQSTVDLLSSMPHLGKTRSDLGSPETRSWRVGGFRNHTGRSKCAGLPDAILVLPGCKLYQSISINWTSDGNWSWFIVTT